MASWKKLVAYNSGDTITVSNPSADTHAVNKAYVDTAVSGENLWNRASTTLSPNTSGDNLDNLGTIGSGAITSTGTIAGVAGTFSGAVTWSGGGSANANTAYTHSQIAGGDSVHVSTTENTQWDTAYTYSQVGHLPLAGGTLTGGLTGTTSIFSGQAKANNFFVSGSQINWGADGGTSGRFRIQAGGQSAELSVMDSNTMTFKTDDTLALTIGTDQSATFTGTVSAEQLTSTDDLTVAGLATIGETLAVTGVATFTAQSVHNGGMSTGALVLNDGSITDTSGAISFGNENLTTTGTVSAEQLTSTDDLTVSGLATIGETLTVTGNTHIKGGLLEVGEHGVAGAQIVSDGDLVYNSAYNDASGNNGDHIFKTFSGGTEIARFKYDLSAVIAGDLVVGGDFTVSGDTTTVNTATITVEDPLIKLASGNSSSDVVDIGFYGLCDPSGSQDTYTGLVRDASDGRYHLFDLLQVEPTTTMNISGAGFDHADLTVGAMTVDDNLTVTGDITVSANSLTIGSTVLSESGSSINFAGGIIATTGTFSGDVGIGGSPSYPLHITKADTGSGASAIFLSSTMTTTGNSQSLQGIKLEPVFVGTGHTTTAGRGLYINPTFTNITTEIGLYVDNGMTILDGGRVGIGTSNPNTHQLEVHGGDWDTSLKIKATGANSGLSFEDSSGNEDVHFLANGDGLKIITGTSDTRMLVGSSGKVGIGTGGYAQKQLHIGDEGQMLLSHGSDTSGEYSGIYFRSESDEEDGMGRTKGLIAFERTGSYGVGDMKFCVENTANNDTVDNSDVALTIASDKSATFAGDVTLSSTSPQLHLTNTGTSASQWVSFNTSAGRTGFVGQGGSGTQIVLHAESGNELLLKSGGSTALTLNTSQNATFDGEITSGYIHVNQTNDYDGIIFRGYDDSNSYYGKIGVSDIGYLRLLADGNRSIDLKSGRQIRFFTSTDNSTYNNSVNFNSDGSSTFNGTIKSDHIWIHDPSTGQWGGRIQYSDSGNLLSIQANEVAGDDMELFANDKIFLKTGSGTVVTLDDLSATFAGNIVGNGRLQCAVSLDATFAHELFNSHSTGHGLKIRGGSTSSHYSLYVSDYNQSNALFYVMGDGSATFAGNVTVTSDVISGSGYLHLKGASTGVKLYKDGTNVGIKLDSGGKVFVGNRFFAGGLDIDPLWTGLLGTGESYHSFKNYAGTGTTVEIVGASGANSGYCMGVLQFVNTSNSSSTLTNGDAKAIAYIKVDNYSSNSMSNVDSGGDMKFYTKSPGSGTDSDSSGNQLALTLDHNHNATFTGDVSVGGDLSVTGSQSFGATTFTGGITGTTGTFSGDVTSNSSIYLQDKKVGIDQSSPTAINGMSTFLHIGKASTDKCGIVFEEQGATGGNEWEIKVDDEWQLWRGSTQSMYIDTSSNATFTKNVAIGTTPTTTGALLNLDHTSTDWIRFYDDSATHGMTSLAPTNCSGMLEQASGNDGGVVLRGLSASKESMYLIGVPATEDTSSGTTAVGAVTIQGQTKSGTSSGAMSATANLFVVQSPTTKFIMKGNGDILQLAGTSSWAGNATFGGNVILDNGTTNGANLTLACSGQTSWEMDNSSGSFRLFRTAGLVGLGFDTSYNATFAGKVTADSLDISRDGSNISANFNGVVIIDVNNAGKETFKFDTTGVNEGYFTIKNVDTVAVRLDADGNSYFNGGNVGINDTDPSEAVLSVVGKSSPDWAQVIVASATKHGLKILAPSTGTSGGLRVMNQAGDADYFMVNGSGKVGIGTGSPDRNLHIDSSAREVALTLENDAQKFKLGVYDMDNAGDDTFFIHCHEAGTDAFKINGTGNATFAGAVYIDTTAHSYLHIKSGGSGYHNGIKYYSGSTSKWTQQINDTDGDFDMCFNPASGGTALKLKESDKSATFAGEINANAVINANANIVMQGGSTSRLLVGNKRAVEGATNGSSLYLGEDFTNTYVVGDLYTSGNATFAGDIDARKGVFHASSYPILKVAYDTAGDNRHLWMNHDQIRFVCNDNVGNPATIAKYGGSSGNNKISFVLANQDGSNLTNELVLEKSSATFAGNVRSNTLLETNSGANGNEVIPLKIRNNAGGGWGAGTAVSMEFLQSDGNGDSPGAKIKCDRTDTYNGSSGNDAKLQFYTAQADSLVLALTLNSNQSATFADALTAGSLTSNGSLTVGGDITAEEITLNSDSHGYVHVNSSASTTATWIDFQQGGTGRWLAGVEGSATDFRIYNLGGSNSTRLSISQDAKSLTMNSTGATFAGNITVSGHSSDLKVYNHLKLVDGSNTFHAGIRGASNTFEVRTSASETIALTIDGSQNATFTGNVTTTGDITVNGGDLQINAPQVTNNQAVVANENVLSLHKAENNPCQRQEVLFGIEKYASGTLGKTQLNISLWEYPSATNVMSMRSDGNVGIGTTSPEDLLHIKGGALSYSYNNYARLIVEGGVNTHNYIQIITQSGYTGGLVMGDNNGSERASIRYTSNSGPMILTTAGATALTIDNSQNATFAGNVTVDSGSSSAGILTIKNDEGTHNIHSDNSMLSIKNGSTDHMTIDSGGSVNIGVGGLTVNGIDSNAGWSIGNGLTYGRMRYMKNLGSGDKRGVQIDGEYDSLMIQGRVIDWTNNNLHFGYGGAHPSTKGVYFNNIAFTKMEGMLHIWDGTNAPADYKLSLRHSVHQDVVFLLYNSNTDGFGGKIRACPTSGGRYILRLSNYSDVTKHSFYGNGAAEMVGSLTQNASDIRLKDNRVLIPSALDKVNSMGGYSFDWNNKQPIHEVGKHDIGLLAQEVQAVLPEAVCLAPFDKYGGEPGTPSYLDGLSKSGEDYLTINYEKVVPLLVNAIKELSAKVEALESE